MCMPDFMVIGEFGHLSTNLLRDRGLSVVLFFMLYGLKSKSLGFLVSFGRREYLCKLDNLISLEVRVH